MKQLWSTSYAILWRQLCRLSLSPTNTHSPLWCDWIECLNTKAISSSIKLDFLLPPQSLRSIVSFSPAAVSNRVNKTLNASMAIGAIALDARHTTHLICTFVTEAESFILVAPVVLFRRTLTPASLCMSGRRAARKRKVFRNSSEQQTRRFSTQTEGNFIASDFLN